MSNEKTTELVETKQLSPVQQVADLIKNGIEPAMLKELLDVQKEWERNEAYKAFNIAMADFKSEAITIVKDKEASFETSKGKTEYGYASLANIVETTTPALGKHRLAATWKPKQEGDKVCVTCRITHSMGHYEDVTLCAKADNTGSKNEIQAMGSTITYLEKYTYLAATGLATRDQDDDGKTAVKFITQWEADDFKKEIDAKGQMGPILKYMGVERIEDVKVEDVQKLKNAIKAAPKKEAK